MSISSKQRQAGLRPQVPQSNHGGNRVTRSPPIEKLHMGLFEIGKALGKGNFGRVYLARHRKSGWICALKVLIKKRIENEEMERDVRREIEVHSNLRHPGIIGFYAWFHDEKRIVLVLEYAAGGELYDVLQRAVRFPEPRAAKYISQVASSLLHLHGKHIMHRDIKPENILVGVYGELKLADFGLSVHAPENRRTTPCGTPDYLAPELTFAMARYTNAIDLWALGVLTYEFLTGVAPFDDDSVAITVRKIRERDMIPLPEFISPEAKDFVNSVRTFRFHMYKSGKRKAVLSLPLPL